MACYTYCPSEILARVVGTVVGVVQLALGARFVLELFGANAGAPFVAWVYAITLPLAAPFLEMFPTFYLGLVFDTSLIVAMIAYALVGWLIVALFRAVFSFATPYEQYETRTTL